MGSTDASDRDALALARSHRHFPMFGTTAGHVEIIDLRSVRQHHNKDIIMGLSTCALLFFYRVYLWSLS